MSNAASRLKWAREHAGYESAAEFARRQGLKEVTYRAHENGLRGLSERAARRYAAGLKGLNWVWLLTGAGEAFKTEGSTAGSVELTREAPVEERGTPVDSATVIMPPPSQLPRDIEVLGVAVGGNDGYFAFNGSVVDYVRRPPGIAAADQVFGIYVVGDSMAPRYEDGDLIYVHKGRRPSVGNDVIIELHGEPGQPGHCFIKRLVRRTAERVVLLQFNPQKEIEIPMRQVRQIFKILTTAELLGV